MEALNELLLGNLDGEVEALQQWKAVYDEERRLSDGSTSCWSGADSDSGSVAELEVGIGSLPMGGAGEEVPQGGEVEGADCEQTGEGKRGDEPAHQLVRHSLWEHSSLEAYNELPFGSTAADGEVAALQQRKAEYDEARRQSDGSDICGSCSDNDSGSVVELEVERGQGPLQPVMGERVQRVESTLHPGELAPKRLRNETMGQHNLGRQQQRGVGRRRGGTERGIRDIASGVCQGSAWILVVERWLLAGT